MHVNRDVGADRAGVQMFQTRHYTPEGEAPPGSIWMTMLMGAIAGALFGIIASIAGYYGFYLVFLVPLLIGAGVGGVMSQGVQITKNRDPWVTATAALAASLVAITTIHISDYYSFLQDREANVPHRDIRDALILKQQDRRLTPGAARMQAREEPGYIASLQVESFPEYMMWQAGEGVSIGSAGPGGGGSDLNLGFYGSLIYWLIEALVIAGIAASMVWARSSQPFCAACDRWSDPKTLGGLTIEAARVASIIEGGNLNGLRLEFASMHETDLKLFRCKQCGSPDQAVVAVERITWHKRQRQVKCVGRFVVSDEGVAFLADLLNQASEELAVLSAVEELSGDVRVCMSSDSAIETAEIGPDAEVQEHIQRLLERERGQTF